MNSSRRRVVITGMGALTPLGQSVDEYWEGLLQGKSGIDVMTLADPTAYPCRIAGEVSDFDPGQYINPKEARQILELPDDVEPIAFTPLGYPDDQPRPKRRKPPAELVRYERW